MLGKAPLTSRDVMMRLIGSMSTTASCINMASNGDLPGMAPHILGGIARYTAGATGLRMSIHMSLASVLVHTMGLQLSGFAHSPNLVQRVYQVRPVGWYVRFPDGDIPQARSQVSL